MSKIVLALFTVLSLLAIYFTYTGAGLEEVKQESLKSYSSYHSSRIGSSGGYSNGGWSFGK